MKDKNLKAELVRIANKLFDVCSQKSKGIFKSPLDIIKAMAGGIDINFVNDLAREVAYDMSKEEIDLINFNMILFMQIYFQVCMDRLQTFPPVPPDRFTKNFIPKDITDIIFQDKHKPECKECKDPGNVFCGFKNYNNYYGGILEVEDIHYEIQKEEYGMTVIFEMPGVEKEEIIIRTDDDSMEVSTPDSEFKNYYKSISIGNGYDLNHVKARYQNGILELKINKAKE